MNEVPEGPKSTDDSPIIEVSGISLDQLAQLDDSMLVHSLNRVLGDVANPDGVVFASFSASL
jgi:FXSXX-COOH protein